MKRESGATLQKRAADRLHQSGGWEMSDLYQGSGGVEYREGYNNGRADVRAELMPEIERLRGDRDAYRESNDRLAEIVSNKNAEIKRLQARITKLEAALRPFAAMYARPGNDLDRKIQDARAAFAKEGK